MPIQTAAQSITNEGVVFGFKNKIINGAFDVWQRGTSSFGTNSSYTADRWWMVNDGVGTTSVDRISVTGTNLSSSYALRFTRSAGASNRFVVGTNLETITTNQMRGKTFTLSVKVRKGSALTSSVYVSLGTQNQEEKYGTLVDDFSFEISNASLNTSTFTTFSKTFTIPAASAGIGFKVEFMATQAGASNVYFDIAEVQLEAGSVVTNFEHRPYGMELMLCQRYCQTVLNGGETACLGFVNGSSNAFIFHQGSVPMRTTPSVSYTTTMYATNYSSNLATITGVGGVGFATNSNVVRIQFTLNSSPTSQVCGVNPSGSLILLLSEL